MPVDSASVVLGGSVWTVFWIQLPVLVLAVAVIIVATTALRRARPEDVPRVFEAFAAAFGRRYRRARRNTRRSNTTKETSR
ncbi:hypothetical protein [Nocardia otitidiscaviarum]|uniref:hypothetical protein n=1 Tax=Nocardia otitidiscaviarum TaxID=1823 RepID=UPI00245798C2|nr:hypothetical protein [Nocardia otitidiscaviarum]